MRKIILMALAAALAIVPLFADEATSGADVAATVDQSTVLEGEWWYGRMLEGFEYDGLQNVAPRTLDSLLRPYIGETYTPELESEIDSLLYSQSWLEYISGYEMLATGTGGLRVRISLQEISMVTQIRFEGNSEVRSATLEAQQSIQVGDFFSPGLLRANAASVRDYYLSHGYAEAVVHYPLRHYRAPHARPVQHLTLHLLPRGRGRKHYALVCRAREKERYESQKHVKRTQEQDYAHCHMCTLIC